MHKTKGGKFAPKGALQGRHKGDPIPVALKLKAVKLHLEEGLVFKRPCHTLSHKRDADAFASVREILEAAKKNPWNPAPA